MTKIKFAFYKGNKTLIDKLITAKQFLGNEDFYWYTHCEIIINGNWISSSLPDGGVRRKLVHPKDKEWDYLEFYITEASLEIIHQRFLNVYGKKYDLLGIFLTQLFPLDIENKEKFFCSELCSYLVRDIFDLTLKPSQYSPASLYSELKYISKKGLHMKTIVEI